VRCTTLRHPPREEARAPHLALLTGSGGSRFGAAAFFLDFGQNLPRHLRFALAVPHAGIKPVLREQHLVRAALDDHAVIEHENFVAPTMVESRCAMTSVVRFCDTRSSSSWISVSVWLSSAEVASSSKRIGAL